MERNYIKSLMCVYNELPPNKGFEVVVVDIYDDPDFNRLRSFDPSHQGKLQKNLEHVLSSIPWTDVPLSDITSRKQLKQRFGIPEVVYRICWISFVNDSTGKVLQCGDLSIFHRYGALGYPFSDERINYLRSEDDRAGRQPSWEALLSSTEVMISFQIKGTKGVTNKNITPKLKTVYEKLAENNKNFEVVLIYLYDTTWTHDITNEDSFLKTFKDMPWLALPFKDTNYKKLERIFDYPWDSDGVDAQGCELIIIGPHMEFIELFGAFILLNFGTQAYPFSLRKVANLLTEEAKELKLEMLWEPQSVLGEKYGFEAQCSQLAGKRVIIIFEWFYSCEWEASFLETLEERYIKLKGTSNEFEVIHIVQDKERCIELKADEFGAIHIDQESCRFETKEQHIANLYRSLYITYNHCSVKFEQLAGKVVVLYFGSVHDMERNYIKSLMCVYNELPPNKGFEVVVVDIYDDPDFNRLRSFDPSHQGKLQKNLEHVLSSIPWTAVPLSDITSRKQLKQRFGIPEVVYRICWISFVNDSTGKVLQCGDLSIFHRYGALGYPFSDERINYLRSEDDRAGRQPSWEALLASTEVMISFQIKGTRPIHTLEDKVVALYFYEEGVTNKNITPKLKTVYEKLAENNKNFEVVLIYLYDTTWTHDITNEDSFLKTFKDMPWLALPFKDTNYKKLERIFDYPWDSDGVDAQGCELIIIGPHMEFIELFGAFILLNFGTQAYPFSLRKVANLLTEEAKELKLEMLWEPQSVLGEKYGFEAQCSQLAGKRVIIIFEWFYSCEWEASFLETLEERYIKLKGTSNEFEVIHIVQDKERCIELKADEFGAIHIDQESCRFETKEQHIANLYRSLYITYNHCNSKKVKFEQLAGKVVVLYFGSVHDMERNYIKSLMCVYNELPPNKGFEVVVVDIYDDPDFNRLRSFDPSHQGKLQKNLEHVLSSIPWTAVPLSDITSRKQLKQRFGIPEVVYRICWISFVNDSTGKVLQCGDLSIFHRYGALGYPFSDERINYLRSEDDRAGRQPSWEALLASTEVMVSFQIKGTRPIHTLEDKVVALYFYEEGVTNKNITPKLKTVYEKLAENNKNFEVVLIYLYDTTWTHDITNEDSFLKTFKDMPWLALPFKDTNYKKLERIFDYPWDSDGVDAQGCELIIIGPHMEFIELFGAFILLNFGTQAYPFSLRKVANLLTEEAKELKLEMLWEPQSVLGEKYGFEHAYAQCSQLAGKRVIIIFEWFYSCEWEASFLETLEERYIKLKGTSNEFEVIHIVQDKERCIELKADEFGAIHIDQESCRFETKEQHIANLYRSLYITYNHCRCRDQILRVKFEQLAGKVVVLYFGSVHDMERNYIKSLMCVYNELPPNKGFEVVVVDIYDDPDFNRLRSFDPSHQGKLQKNLEHVLSSIPWTAVPLSDITSRKQLKQRFGIPEVVYRICWISFVNDSTGKVLQCGDLSIFHRYGALGYPFSDERINYLRSEDDRAGRQPSWEALLASTEVMVSFQIKGTRPIHTLEDKVVALYFYEEGVTNKNITPKLKTVYEKLAENNKNFEVVLIYLYDTTWTHDITNEDSFLKTFKDMPWLALPFKDTNYKKLERIFDYPWDSDG
ncbi:hypothetical protein OROMI_002906 [Orobanche minor]